MSKILKPHHQWWVEEARSDFVSEVFVVTAGLGSGKTHGACQWHHDRVARNSKAQFSAFLTVSFQKIHDAILPTYEKVLQSYGYIKGYHYDVVRSPYPKLRYRNGQEVHFLSAQKPDKLIAVEYSHGTISEAGSIKDDEVFNLLDTRVRDNRAVIRQIMLEGVTQGTTGWYYNLFDYNPANGWVKLAERDYVNRSKLFRRFRLTSHDNPNLPDNYVEKLKRRYAHAPMYIQAWVYGFFVPLFTGSAYDEYDPQKFRIEDIEADPYKDIFLTWDFNNNPLAWVSVQRVLFDDEDGRKHRYVCIHEANSDNTKLMDACAEFAVKHPPARFSNTKIRLFGDRSGYNETHRDVMDDYKQMKYYLHQYGFKNVTIEASKSNPRETISVEAVNRSFLEDTLFLCKRCYMLDRSLVSTRWKEGTKKLDKPSGEDWTHHGDALKYLMFAIISDSGKKKLTSYNI